MSVERPTFSESWYRVGDLRPTLRPTVQIHRQHFRGQMWHVVQDPSNNQFSRLSDAAYRFVALLDGKRTVAQSWKICNEQLGDAAPTQGEAIQLLGQLYVSNLLLSEVPPDAVSLFERYKKRIRREVQGYLANLLFVRIPVYDPDNFLNRWVGLFGAVFSAGGLVTLALMLMAGLYSASGMFGELFNYSRRMGLGSPGQEGILAPANLPLLYGCFILVKVFHEFGHAFACKKFGRQEGSGGEVHVMGVMFLIFTPFPYVDASSSWAFRSKWRRIVVGAAGVLVELGIASIAAIVYSQTAEGAVLHKIAYNIIFIAGVSTVLFNGNPLLRYDGYYILSDLLEIPNLAQRSKQFVYYLVRKYAWGVRNLRSPAHTPGEQAWMIVYGICSTIYRVFICIAILLFVADQLFLLGAVLAAAAIIAWVFVPLGKFAHYLASNTELMRCRGRAVATTLITLVLIVAIIGFIPAPDRFTLEGIVEPVDQALVFAEADGFIQSVLPSGQSVKGGQTEIIAAENRDLELQRKQLVAKLAAFQAERRMAQMSQQTKVQELDSAILAVTKYLEYVDKQLAGLRIKSAISGTWISPECDRYVGAYVKKGQKLGMVADLTRMKIVAVSPQSVPLTSPEDPVASHVEIRVKKRPPAFYAGLLIGRTSNELTGAIERIYPAAHQELPSPALSYAAGGSIETDPHDKDNVKAAEPIFEMHVLPDQSSEFMPGQRVEVRIRRQDKPLAEQAWLSILQLIQRRFHSSMPAPTPSMTWRMLTQRNTNKELPRGIDAAYDAAVGIIGRVVPRRHMYLKRAQRVLDLEGQYKDLTDARLKDKALEIREMFVRARETPADIERSFAIVREVAWRLLGEKPFHVQIAGAMAMEQGCVAEMATGEGKTLTASLLATVFGWRGRGCHVVTVNDYLAKRDAEWMGKIYNFCGLTVSYVQGGMFPPDRRKAYLADITYGTNKEVTADFLRDRISLGRLKGLSSALLAKIADGGGSGTDRLVQRGLHFAIVDEADSVLIDEAVTPLIISGDAPNEEQVQAFKDATALAVRLEKGRHYKINMRYREVDLTNAGKRALAELAEPLGGIWLGARRREEIVTQALTAHQFYIRDKQYIIDKDKKTNEDAVVIVDEFTGRLMPDRNWRDGLHQAVEAKEKLTVNPPKDTLARVSFQRFFRLYRRLCGMTGTAFEGWREFWQIYHMPVVVIPTNRPCVRKVMPDRVYATEETKWKAIVDEIIAHHLKGRPVLVGTRSVRASELLSTMLTAQGMDHQVLNAVRHAEEAQIIAQAGATGRVTVATNMAGRGTDIKLGRGVADAGGLHVIASERHESGRVDRQLFGRSARQGDPGSAQAIVSLEDELGRRYSPTLIKALARRHGRTTRRVDSALVHRVFDMAQGRAERLALRQRKGVLQTDNWLDEYLGFAGTET